MKTQWPHGGLNQAGERREAPSATEQRMRTRYLPAERQDTLPAESDTTITLSFSLLRG